jgi:hypothetical protein
MRFSVYLAGKIPKGDEVKDFRDWRKEFAGIAEGKLKDYPKVSGMVFLDPYTLETTRLGSTLDFFGRDIHLIRMSDAVLVDARKKIGAGTAQEILIAKYFGKPVVTVVPKDSHYCRKALVHGAEVEYRQPFVYCPSDAVVEDFGEAADWLLRFFSGEMKIEIKGIDVLEKAEKDYLDKHVHKDEFVNGWNNEMTVAEGAGLGD